MLVKEANNLWELPGGGVDYGENLQECLKREVMEEMGLEGVFVATEPSYFFTSTNLKGRNIANVLYETKVLHYNFKPSEKCIEIGFFTLEEAKKLETYPNIHEFLKHYNPQSHVHL